MKHILGIQRGKQHFILCGLFQSLRLPKPVVWAHLRSPGPGVVLERTPGVLHHPLLAAPLLPRDPC